MWSFTFLVVVACALTAEVFAIPKGSHHNAAGATGACTVAAGAGTVAASSSGATAVASTTSPVSLATSVAAASEAVTRGSTTEVLFEIHGVQNNECLTFRNNGEIVDAACVDTSADRQITPSTLNGASVLLVQRSFDASFRPDLVGVDAIVGFNGTDFKAEPAGAAGIIPVTFSGGELKAGTVCASGHDGAAQLTVDLMGKTCAQYTSTVVTATAP